MRGLYGKITKYQANVIRTAYRTEHPYCFRAYQVKGVWRLCRGRRSLECNEIAHGNNRVIHQANLIMYCGFPGGRCHHGIFHREDNPEQSDARLMLEAYAVKVIMGEITYEEVALLMKGRSWWTEAMGSEATVIQACAALVEEMKGMVATELPYWHREQERISQVTRSKT